MEVAEPHRTVTHVSRVADSTASAPEFQVAEPCSRVTQPSAALIPPVAGRLMAAQPD